MKILAVIPARGGSKRLPGKNIRLLDGIPLIAWSIRSAHESGVCTKVVVSTDDTHIAEVAERYGATAPGLRPSVLASDTASSVDVCLHALDVYLNSGEEVDGLLLLQPTSPFRSAAVIRHSVALFTQNAKRSIVSVSPAASHPLLCYQIQRNRLEPFIGSDTAVLRSQDLPPAYALNGAIYLITPKDLRMHRAFLLPDTVPLICDQPELAIDIDTEWDWKMAEVALKMVDR